MCRRCVCVCVCRIMCACSCVCTVYMYVWEEGGRVHTHILYIKVHVHTLQYTRLPSRLGVYTSTHELQTQHTPARVADNTQSTQNPPTGLGGVNWARTALSYRAHNRYCDRATWVCVECVCGGGGRVRAHVLVCVRTCKDNCTMKECYNHFHEYTAATNITNLPTHPTHRQLNTHSTYYNSIRTSWRHTNTHTHVHTGWIYRASCTILVSSSVHKLRVSRSHC